MMPWQLEKLKLDPATTFLVIPECILEVASMPATKTPSRPKGV